jgi:hypothetical protein
LTVDEVMSEDDDNNTNSLSIEHIVRELDREETNIVISKEIKKFNKPTTVVRGLEERKEVQSYFNRVSTLLVTLRNLENNQPTVFN